MNPQLRHLSQALLLATLVHSIAYAQPTPGTRLTYAVATIKPSHPDQQDSTSIGYEHGTFTAENMPLVDVIKYAYDFSENADQQIVGGPSWLRNTKFTIVAKADPETIADFKKLPEKQRDRQIDDMILTILKDRFHLVVHHDTRVLPLYQLILAKGGSKLTPSKKDVNAPDAGSGQLGNGFIKGIACEVDALAGFLETIPEIDKRLIVDKTGLTGLYDFTLRWTPDPTGGIAPPGADSGAKQLGSAPSLFTAIQEQLGLKLVPAKGPVDIVVIDHIDMPTPD